jgi:hypothetical protein
MKKVMTYNPANMPAMPMNGGAGYAPAYDYGRATGVLTFFES